MKDKIKTALLRGLVVNVFLYFGLLFLAATRVTVSNPQAAAAFTRQLTVHSVYLLLFSLVLGFSFLIFDTKKLPSSGKWLLHIVLLYSASLAVSYLVAGVGSSPKERVNHFFFTTLLFFLIYGISALVAHIIKKRR